MDLPVTAFVPADWITDPDEKIAAYRAAADCLTAEALVELAAGWADRYGALPAAVVSLLQLMELKLLAKRCGFSRIKPEKPNIVLETPMEEPAFRLLRQGLPQHLHGRLVYQPGSGIQHKVMARGLLIRISDPVRRHEGRDGEVHLGVFNAGDVLTLNFRQGFLQHFHVEVKANGFHLAALLHAEEISDPTDLHIPHGELIPTAQLGLSLIHI